MKTKRRQSLLLLLLLASVPARAGVGLWTPFGPGKAGIRDFVLQPGAAGGPSALYVLAGGAPFVTRDQGESWTWVGAGLAPIPWRLAAGPATPETLYIASSYGGIFRSTDGGRQWSFVRTLDGEAVPPGALAVVGTTLYAGTLQGIVRSRDGGETWTLTSYPKPVVAIVPHPVDPRTLYVADGSGSGVWKSADEGETWSPLLETESELRCLAVSADASTLYAGDFEGYVYASADRGETWNRTFVNDAIEGLAVDPGSPSRVYASSSRGIAVSTDGGATWQTTLPSLALIPSWMGRVAVDPARPGVVYALSIYEGIAVSRDRGLTWSFPLQRGLGFPPTNLMKRNPDEPSRLVVCRSLNLTLSCLYSRDEGRTWTLFLDFGDIGQSEVKDLAFEPRNPDVVYTIGYRGVYVVRMSKGTAQRLPLDDRRSLDLKAVAVSGRTLIVGGSYGAFRSTDGGGTWKTVLPWILPGKTRLRAVLHLVQDPENAGILYAVARETGLDGGNARFVLYQSSNGGARWQRLREGPQLLVVDPSRPKTLYAVQGANFLRSRDRGATWKVQGTFPTESVQDVAIDPERPSALLAATDGFGVLLSEDFGHTWAPFNAGLAGPELLRIRTVTADPKVPGRFFALPVGSEVPPSGGVFEATVE